MSDSTDDALILLEILEVLGACRALVSYADVCVHLSGRYELQPLLELRSLLYSTACRDPCFPATLFRERLHLPCSNRLSAAADVVSLFNLLTHTRLPPTHKDYSLTSCLACDQDRACRDWLRGRGGAIAPGCKYEDSTQKLITYYTPPHLLASMHSGLHALNRRSMQKAHSLDIPSGTGNQESDRKVSVATEDVDPAHLCAHKRRVFKGDFHNLLPFVPIESRKLSEQSPDEFREEGKDVRFQACRNPYSDSPAAQLTDSLQMHTHDSEESLDAETVYPQKHKSLDDLQSSTYFGPTVIERIHPSPALMGKSYSLDIDSRLADASENEVPGLDQTKPHRPRSEKSALDKSGLSKPGLHKISFEGSSFDIPGFDPYIVRSVHDTLKRLSGLSLDAWYDWSPDADAVVSVGTQTDLGDRRALKSLLLSDKLSIDNTDIDEDDISAIFRFLDDISMCGSMAVLPGAAGGPHDGGGAGGLPERRERLGKLRRLFHSLEGPEEGVRWGVGRLLQRVTELEQRLEPISELRDQLALVLTTLKRLEEREQIVHAYIEPLPAQQQPPPGAGNQQKGDKRPSLCVDRAEVVAAKRRGLFANPNSRNHTASSGSEQHSELNVSYSREQITLHPSQAELQCKKDVQPVQERKSSIFIPHTHRASLQSSDQNPNMRPTDRPKVSWSQSELVPLDLQTHESMDFWMDEVYTPVSDTLLRRSQSLTRCSRSQSYRVTAISITATVILILIIVIPICTA
ncbi:major intrinsically disordered Notch2-binding receptor 1 [Trichomycterus rosablanca]|uniref:major intrinsically disordered Notch2-binding receptor 1 n=1 Tax=Trichomycterus rosablanca TaxID=2290929 RepID=UPI002F350523